MASIQAFPFQGPDVRPIIAPPFNVLNYGAVGNGVTDDSAAIQAAANAAAAAQYGGVVYLPAGNYFISTGILIGNNTYIMGESRDSTFMTLSANAKTNGAFSNIMIANSRWTEGGTHGNQTWQQNMRVSDIGFNGNADNNALNGNNQGAVYFVGVYNVEVFNCYIMNAANHGISVIGTLSHGSYNPAPIVSAVIHDNIINLTEGTTIPNPGGAQNTGNFPIRCEGFQYLHVYGNTIGSKFLANTHTNDGIDAPFVNDCIIHDNYVSNIVDGIGTNGTGRVAIYGNIVHNYSGQGIASYESDGTLGGVNDLLISNNIVYVDNGYGFPPAGSAIRAIGPDSGSGAPGPIPVRFAITGNLCFNNPTTAIHTNMDYGTVTGNVIDMNGNANVNGITIDPGANPFGEGYAGNQVVISGNVIRNGGASSNGIVAGSGGPTPNCVITGNTIQGVTVALSPTFGNMSNCIIKNNVGINPWGNVTTPGFPASGVAVNNTFPFDIQVSINAGAATTITNVKINGVGLGSTSLANSSVVVMLPAGSNNTITVNYTGASIGWQWFAM